MQDVCVCVFVPTSLLVEALAGINVIQRQKNCPCDGKCYTNVVPVLKIIIVHSVDVVR